MFRRMLRSPVFNQISHVRDTGPQATYANMH